MRIAAARVHIVNRNAGRYRGGRAVTGNDPGIQTNGKSSGAAEGNLTAYIVMVSQIGERVVVAMRGKLRRG